MNVLLAYALADGREPAARLADLLRTMGVAVVDATGAMPAPEGASVIAVLTPAALNDRAVLGLLQQAPAQGRRLLPLSAPAEANFPTPDDLARIIEWWSSAAARPALAQGGKYHVVTAVNSTIGDNGVTVNTFGRGAGWSAAEAAQLVMALRSQQTGAPMSAQELRSLFAGLQAQVQQVDLSLQRAFTFMLGRFDLMEQRILAPILARLDSQQAEQTAALLDALEAHTFPAGELSRHLATIQMALAEVNVRAAQISDRQFAESAAQMAELASEPGLDVKHKLKLTIPIVPLLLAYEGEFELNSRLSLGEVWRSVQGWLKAR